MICKGKAQRLWLSKSSCAKESTTTTQSLFSITGKPIENTHHHCPIKNTTPSFSLLQISNPLPALSLQPTFISSILSIYSVLLHTSNTARSFYTNNKIMAAFGSFRSLFENPKPENPSLFESLSSWNQIKPMKSIEPSSFAEIFGELYFQENPKQPATNPPLPTPPPSESSLSISPSSDSPLSTSPPSMSIPLDQSPQLNISEFDSKKDQNAENQPLDSLLGASKNRYKCNVKSNGAFSAKKSESLLHCTEGLGSESSDDVDDLLESGDDWKNHVRETRRWRMAHDRVHEYSKNNWDTRSSKRGKEFPPPISSIGKSGKPRVCLRSYREDGRFVLREIRIPSQELLHASREDGRLKLHFVHPDEDIEEGEEEQEQDEDEEELEVEKGEGKEVE